MRKLSDHFIESVKKVYPTIRGLDKPPDFFLDKARTLRKFFNIGGLNPVPWLLGYSVIRDKKINKDLLESRFSIYEASRSTTGILVTKEDIVRYARHWLRYLF